MDGSCRTEKLKSLALAGLVLALAPSAFALRDPAMPVASVVAKAAIADAEDLTTAGNQAAVAVETAAPSPVLALGGFFDVHAMPSRRGNRVSLGSVELALTRSIANAQLGAAVVIDPEGAATITNAFADFRLSRRGDDPGPRLQIGRFDVPFGRDWQQFAAKDRTEASAPLSTELVLDGGLNATGVHFYGDATRSNYSVYAFRGDGEERLIGTRAGVLPFDFPFEAGASWMQALAKDGSERARWVALDTELTWQGFHVRAEWTQRNARASAPEDRWASEGWHVTVAKKNLTVASTPVTPYVRYDRGSEARAGARAFAHGSSTTDRLTAGIRAQWFRSLLTKVEYRRFLEAPPAIKAEEGFDRNVWCLQAIVVF